MNDSTITAHELKARWAFREMSKERWAHHYAHLPPAQVRRDVEFVELSDGEKAALISALARYRNGFLTAVDQFPTYVLTTWSQTQLGQTHTIPRFGPSPHRSANIPFPTFLKAPPFPEDGEHDPRAKAKAVPFDEPFSQDEPVIVLPINGMLILVEGYLRSVLFMRKERPKAQIEVWFPASAKWPFSD